jgi:hypothetical protein
VSFLGVLGYLQPEKPFHVCGVVNGRLILKLVNMCITNRTEHLAELAVLVLLVEKIRKLHSLYTSAAHWKFTGFVPHSKMEYRFIR